MDIFKRATEQVRQMWSNLGAGQRILLSAALAGVFLFLVWGSVVTSGEAMALVVGVEVSDEDRGRVLARLREQNQRFETRNREIYVPKQDADRVILELAGEGVLTGTAIWNYLNQSNILDDRGVRDKKYQVAVQRQLEQMIRSIDGIRSARVLLNFANPTSGMFQNSPRPGASVMVELAPGKVLSQRNVEAINGMVARVVPGLESHEVILADTGGNPYRAVKRKTGAPDAWDIHSQERQRADEKAEALMKMFPGSTVIVDIRLRNKESRTTEKKHGQAVPYESDTHRRRDRGGQAGTGVGIKAAESVDPFAAGTPGARRDEDEQTTHEKNKVDEKTLEEVHPAGEIEKISVAMNLPFEVGQDGKMDDAGAARRVAEVKRQVINAVGAPADDSTVSVVAVAIRRPESVGEPTVAERSTEFLSRKWPQLALYALAGLALLFMIRLVLRAAPRSAAEELAGLKARIDEPEAPAEELAIAGEQTEVGRLKTGIREIVGRNPAGGGAILNRWMSGK